MYPVCLNISGKLCLVAGGGRVAERKVRGLLASGGRVRVVSPVVTAALKFLAEQERIEWRQKTYETADLQGVFLVFAATDLAEVQNALSRDARDAGLLINRADAPEACDFQVPASVRRGNLTLSVATNGRSPALAAMVRRRLEHDFGEEYVLLTALMARLRDDILLEEDGERKKILFQQILHEDIVDWIRDDHWDRIRQHLQAVLGRPVEVDPDLLRKEGS
ncbi:bifunctional precorrin-2 dehydrogenase/sirohydrochlorin ferrochelatase [Desulfobulbus alkaliphilus]|nr:bifunctional precorrin-2 dehydrogenase/sirohydrochlorin ferrochelatase [Desulfobulbus alkaliphilus]MBM9537206.1 bifunctional precorrin-2 dehydrogenase/sirohydrochlorin ferrochelatase [Desulfobulbus alkaliphilus]